MPKSITEGATVEKKIKARYSKGKFEPLESIDLPEGSLIFISIQQVPSEGEEKGSFELAAGAWKGLVDTDALLRDFKESRKIRAPEVRL